ncbi:MULTISPECIES: DUF896 domain-containing protein [Bacillaceae]|jgi:uncharacterized protein YnzC (UPF0291/DUF896 family)|uniref:DUF896 domain-containing protein n=1 Tax=Bacillaceae TaxID=186817 RepID=UPI001E6541A6|nr:MULTISPECIES: DUF896 domain-containing protein [Bacillaceae]MCE4047952.1 DUF896 domain-containing protein [Bacillus sp. Au-Bac7]MCM3032483.1 DUF896 domain-containing protein [Niallia sp. MER 6]MDL0436389.1 DUF896 domain-containing protein [Niallia sp. SS-2023]UPO89212.1 DUF896 domain-containing protein [Niallia sp. Man26]
MISNEKLNRINELAKKKKEQGLTEAEAKEQTALRAEYLKTFRSNMLTTLEGVKIYDPNGDDVTPQKIKDIQEKKKLH